MIFAAGLGTRLKPLTDTLPKALVPVCGKPLIEHVARKLQASGIDEAVVNIHYFADKVEERHLHRSGYPSRRRMLWMAGCCLR